VPYLFGRWSQSKTPARTIADVADQYSAMEII
jgi:hypothetical protein